MTKQRFPRLSPRTLVHFSAAVFALVGPGSRSYALAQLPSNWSLKDREPFKTCARNSPAPTGLTLSTRTADTLRLARATTDAPFFGWPADSGQWITLTRPDKDGWAQITSFIDSMNVEVKITEGFSLPTTRRAEPGTWSRWPICYMRATNKMYGFNMGEGHQKGATNLTLGFDGQQYSVDRCSLAHDVHYWGDGCNNNVWVAYCVASTQPRTQEEDEARKVAVNHWNQLLKSAVAERCGVAGAFCSLGMELGLTPPTNLKRWEEWNPCPTKQPWIELPTNPRDIPGARAACYGGKGQVIRGFKGLLLDVSGWNHEKGANVIIWHSNDGCNQKWRKLGTGNPEDGFEIRGLGGKCLGTPTNSLPSPGWSVQMWNCDGSANQKWHHEHGQLRVHNKKPPRLCLDVNERTSPMRAILAKCASINPTRNPSQQWRFVAP